MTEAETRSASRGFRPLRLVFLFQFVVAIVLAIYTAAAYAFLDHRVYSEMDNTLRVDFEAAETFTRAGQAEPHHESSSKRWVEVRDASGKVIAREGPSTPLPAPTPAPKAKPR